MTTDVISLVTEVAALSRQGNAALELSRSRARAALESGGDCTDAIAAFQVFAVGLATLGTAYGTLDMHNLPFSYLADKTDGDLRRFRQVDQGAEAIALRDALDIPALNLGDCMEGTAAALKAVLPIIRSSFQTGDRLLGVRC